MIKHFLFLSYLVATFFFIFGLKFMSHPRTAARGNRIGIIGAALAVLATLFFYDGGFGVAHQWYWLIIGLALGAWIGYHMAMRVEMTQMPEMVSVFNGFGGASAMLISIASYLQVTLPQEHDVAQFLEQLKVLLQKQTGNLEGYMLLTLSNLFVGATAFTGSMVAYGKLSGKLRKDWVSKYQQIINVALLAGYIVYMFVLVYGSDQWGVWHILPLTLIGLYYGISFVMPIGGGDMPVAISLLNAFTGVTTMLTGFLYDNWAMITGGILVGSSGTILTVLMCQAMNRSLWNVITGALVAAKGKTIEGSVKTIDPSDAAILLAYANRVIIVPGYGMARAQAQHRIHELEKQLRERGVEVYYAIHPVAGRMPGHMNVLLAEADVPYELLIEMEQANELMPQTDVAVVIGANDVVNPSAKEDPSSPIYGMPIIEVDKAKQVIVIKRGMGKGYAGIENPLFYKENTRMLFNDAKKAVESILNELKNL